uniref:Uncharacterized protein n=1 Tax=Arundo donax TaxID=35708 RepID=A0A0A9H1F1_ARUDO
MRLIGNVRADRQ